MPINYLNHMKKLFFLFITFRSLSACAQQAESPRIYPTNWWVGMHYAKPELMIHADDVSCAHGNTVGSLDEDALFYMRARGIPEFEARALLMEAFVGEVVDRIRHEGARAAAHAWVSEKLRTLS